MRLTTTFLLLGLLTATVAEAQRGQRNNRGANAGSYGAVLDNGGDFYSAVGGTPTMGATANQITSNNLLPRNVFKITLTNTGTNWEEEFLIGIPSNPQSPAPLLTVFAGYGQDPIDMITKTSYFQEAMARGWYVIAPEAAHKFNYAIDYAQTNVEHAHDWCANFLNIDVSRMYSVGFSMGGGLATSYGARHQDSMGPRFAAIAVHTGTCSIKDTYVHGGDEDLMENALMFGGSPFEVPLRYTAASGIDYDSVLDEVDQGTDMVRNLAHVPVYHFAALNDPNNYLVVQTEKQHAQLTARGGNTSWNSTNASTHKWETMNETTVLNFLEGHTLQTDVGIGAPSRVLADRDATWHDITVVRSEDDAVAPFRFTSLPSLNRIYLDEAENVRQFIFDPNDLELDRSSNVGVVINNVSNDTIYVTLEGYAQPPSDVQRNGSSTGSYIYNAGAQTLTLIEDVSGAYPLWTVIP